MLKERVIDPKDAYWVDLCLHQPALLAEPIRVVLHEKYSWLGNIICVCAYCQASRLEDVKQITSNK